jgi:nicotinate-nucleotide pyrophosphorylase (carboxylating)
MTPYEVEVDTLDQLDEVLALGAELVLLDNFDVERTREAVRRRDARSASGARIGTDRLAVRGGYRPRACR